MIKNKCLWPLTAAAVTATLLLTGCESESKKPVADGEYRSMIRLWPAHHLDDSLEMQLIEAFKKYPGSCDEVWFCVEDGLDVTPEEQAKRRDKMMKAADDVRSLGIIAGLQTVTIGHPSHLTVDSDINDFGWRAMTGPDGSHCATQTCPRDSSFLAFQAAYHAYYSETLQPDGIYIDDDLRITQHYPAVSICFCDHCIAEFNAKHSCSFTRESLVKALLDNEEGVRANWIAFSQESLAIVGGYIAKAVHEVSPDTHMGLQHVNFHNALLEGRDWNPIFDAMEEATGNVPVSRPGHGFYNDHSPRGMIEKAYGISRQINRLNPDITLISPEIEGYFHKSTGKSPQSICTETMLYLGMGATSMSYAIICSGQEPISWYADNYFKALDKYHPLFKEYVAHNKGTVGGGIDSYISPTHFQRDVKPWEDPWAWSQTGAGNGIMELSPLCVPFTPEGKKTTASMLDYEAVIGMTDQEIADFFASTGVVMDASAYKEIVDRNLGSLLENVPAPDGLKDVTCYKSSTGKNIAVIPSVTGDVNIAQRNNTLRIFDWASDGKMAVIVESMAQGVVAPRVTEDGTLKSVVFVNATISTIDGPTFRLRGCPQGSRFSWMDADHGEKKLKAVRDGEDYIVTIPSVRAWDAGWIKVY